MRAMHDSRSLDDLHPVVRAMAVLMLQRADEAGIPLVVTFTTRSLERQAELYAQGRTLPGEIVTNAPAGHSLHNYGLALDVVPQELLALPSWGDTPEHGTRAGELWTAVGAIGKAVGFRWGGDFHARPDRPHFEWSGGLTIADLLAGRRPDNPIRERSSA